MLLRTPDGSIRPATPEEEKVFVPLAQLIWHEQAGDDVTSELHEFLCHPDGEECPDGCDAEAIPERLALYRRTQVL